MKKKHLLYIFGIGLLIFISIPSIHLLKTPFAENKIENSISKGYANDESDLNLTKIDSLVDVRSDSTELINQLKSPLTH